MKVPVKGFNNTVMLYLCIYVILRIMADHENNTINRNNLFFTGYKFSVTHAIFDHQGIVLFSMLPIEVKLLSSLSFKYEMKSS